MKHTILLFFLCFTFSSYCQNIIISDKQIPQDISSFASVFEDDSNLMSFEEIQKKNFKINTNKVVIFPFSDHTFWVKFTIENHLPNEKKWVLRWVNSLVEHLDFYIPQADGSYKIYKDGGMVYKEKNKFTENLPDVEFEIFDNKAHDYFIKIKSQRGHSGSLEIFTKNNYIEEKYSKFKREGLFNGLFLLRLFYVLLLAFFIIKDKTFLRYSLLIILRSGAYWGIMGILGGTFTKNPVLGMHLNYLFYYLVPLGYVLVIASVLEFKRFPKIVPIIHKIIIALSLILSACIALNYHWYWLKAATYLLVFSIFYSLVLFGISIVKKYKVDWAYAIPILLGMLSNLYLPMRLLGMRDFPGTYAISTTFFVAEILIFGLFLGKIIRNYEKNKVQTENELNLNIELATKLKEIDALKTNFFANISHEFRTPLTLILSPIEDLLKKNPSVEIYKIIHRNANRLLELINQLLDLSKLEAGQMKAELKEVELKQFFRRLTSSFHSLAESKNIAFEVNIFKETIFGKIDEDKVEKIVNNLLSNAFKFTEKGKKVLVDISYLIDNQALIIKIKDEGIGISKGKIPKVFDRFYQVDDSKNRKFEGTGIGLALVKELVDVLNGEISVESEENFGTSFILKIPLSLVQKVNLEEAVDSLQSSTMNKKEFTTSESIESNQTAKSENILLIVDDNEDIRAYISSIFNESYQIIEAKNGIEGLKKATENIPNLIISDLMMPEMDGFEFCKMLKSDEKTSHIPVIMLTAKANIESRIEGLELGADDYLLKPFNASEIQIRVKNLVEKQEKLRQYFQGNTIELKPNEIKVSSKEAIFIKKVKDIAEIHLSESNFSAVEFAEEMNMSQTQLLRKLKALTNQTINEFIRDFRLQRAADLLSKKAATVSEIAYQVGFESLSYFTKTFQEKFGKLPSEYS